MYKETMDSKGRTLVQDMSNEEKVNEILLTMRALADALEELGNNPMLKAMMPNGVKVK